MKEFLAYCFYITVTAMVLFLIMYMFGIIRPSGAAMERLEFVLICVIACGVAVRENKK